MQGKPWTSRQISGATLAAIGALITVAKEPVMKQLAGYPLALFGLVKIVLTICGPFFLVIGLYRLATKDKALSPEQTKRNRIILVVSVVAAVAGGIYLFGRQTSPLARTHIDLPGSWVQIDANSKGDSLHIGNVERSGNLVGYWTKLVFVTPRSAGNMQSSLFLDKFVADCNSKTISHKLSYAVVNSNQVMELHLDLPQEVFAPLPADRGNPDSISFRKVCEST